MDENRLKLQGELVKELVRMAARAIKMAKRIKTEPMIDDETVQDGYISLKISLQRIAYTKRTIRYTNGNYTPKKRPQKK